MQFDIVICGLDSVEARRWINATLVGMVDMEDQRSLKPLIDGGTEGEKSTEKGGSKVEADAKDQASKDKLVSSIPQLLLASSVSWICMPHELKYRCVR